MADTAKFRSDIDEQYRRPAWSPATPAMRTPAQVPEYTAQGVGESVGSAARSGVEGAAGVAVRGAQQLAGVAGPAVGSMYQAATYVPRTMLRGAADFGAGVLRGAGVLPEEAAAAPAVTPTPVRPAAMLPMEPGPVRPAATLPMEPGPGSGTGFRIIRREGMAPILTNVDNPYAAISQGRNSIQTDEGRTDFLGGVPQGFRSSAPVAAVQQPAVEQGFRPARSGQRVYAPTYNAVFGTVAQQRAAYDANLLGQQNADTARMTAETGQVNALAALQKALNEPKADLPKVSLTEVQDPTDPLKMRYMLSEDGVPTPTYIDPENPIQARALKVYNRARLEGGEAARVPFSDFLKYAEQEANQGAM